MKYYIDGSGAYLGGWDANPPEGAIAVDPPPLYADQLWLFPGWGDSREMLSGIESEWRSEQMPIAQQNVTALEYGEEDILGTSDQWKTYWLALRKWTDTNPDFPDSTKRPVAPT